MRKSKEPLIGCHVSIAGGIHKAFQRGESVGCTTMQIFTKSNRTLFGTKLDKKDVDLFLQAKKESTIQSIIVHTGYLINIGSNKPTTAKVSTNALLDEVHRCELLKLPYIVLHPGSHLGAGEDKCIQQIATNLDHVLEQSDGSVTILLETMAGQGTNVGYAFEQLKEIRSACHHKRKIGFCFDTCHVFASGYDISMPKGYKDTIKKFDTILGLNHLKAMHLNDSSETCNSYKDRHAPLGKGHIPLAIFGLIMNDRQLKDIPKILETPSDDDMSLWAKEIKLLKGMLK